MSEPDSSGGDPRGRPASPPPPDGDEPRGFWEHVLGFFIDNKLVVVILVLLVAIGGLMTAPFDWKLGSLPRRPVPVDAIPDIGENQQIVFTQWPGRSPRDVEDQISYPLTTALSGISGVRTIRSFSMFGFSSIYVIFDESTEFYWSRSRILEKLASLPPDTLPDGVSPALGPDATALGQVFWYTLEGRDPGGNPAGGFDLHELRSIQDWTVRYALQSVPGVAEVASVGGFVQEYQVDVNAEAAKAHGVPLDKIAMAVKSANLDVGARTVEMEGVEYVVRGKGFLEAPEDLEEVVVDLRDHTPIRVRDVAKVGLGPAQRRGALDVGGAPAVGGVVVTRFGANPLEVIQRVQAKIDELAPGLPKRTLDDGTVSQVRIVPFYDRTGLIHETLDTLSTALGQQILITIIVVLILLRHLRSSLLISSILPLGVLGAFVLMKALSVDANIMALSGIAIAIGTMVDMGIVFVENMVEHLDRAPEGASRSAVLRRAAAEVAPAVLTSTTTTIVGFVPIFGLTAAEGKLFSPLAYTKTFAMSVALLLAMLVLPAAAHVLLRQRRHDSVTGGRPRSLSSILLRKNAWFDWALVAASVLVIATTSAFVGGVLVLLALGRVAEPLLPEQLRRVPTVAASLVAALAVSGVLADSWLPLGPEPGDWANRGFVLALVVALLGSFALFLAVYPRVLGWSLRHKITTVTGIGAIVLAGAIAWRGFDALFGWLPRPIAETTPAVELRHAFPGFGSEFMPPFDEGSFLYMPTTMPHASIGTSLEMLEDVDAAIAAIPEIDTAVGKLGRADSPLDPAPISMFETIVNYKPEYRLDHHGRRMTFRYDSATETFPRDEHGEPIPDPEGRPFRQWRPHIKDTHDLWAEIQKVARRPGLTSAPELMPIATRLIMLQSGMRAPMGLKVHGPTLAAIEEAGLAIERALAEVPGIRSETVVADRIVGKPYLEIEIDRAEIARYGISIDHVQNVIQIAIGGKILTRTVEGRERYPVRVRYMREERDDVRAIRRVLVSTAQGHEIPLEQIAKIRYVRGPQVIKSEDTFLTGYVTFDKAPDVAEVDVVEQATAHLDRQIAAGQLVLPAGVSYRFAGSYENQLRSQKSLLILFPAALSVIFLLIYLQFRRVSTALIIYSGVLLGIAGGMLLLWLYGQPWFLDASPFGVDLRALFRVRTVNLSVAVWVGFVALVGVATDNGVVLATYLHERFERDAPTSVDDIRQRALEAGARRARPCLMTTATTLLALLPVVTSTGKGADVMLPMALPSLGGMAVALLSLLLVPVLFAWGEELRFRTRRLASPPAVPPPDERSLAT